MSALFTDMLVVVAVAMTVAVGGDTEELMREDVWEVAGLCEDLKAIGRSCSYSDDSVECAELRSRYYRPCRYDVWRAIRVAVPDRGVRSGPDRTLYAPEWVPVEATALAALVGPAKRVLCPLGRAGGPGKLRPRPPAEVPHSPR
jgi:hypothetical protein